MELQSPLPPDILSLAIACFAPAARQFHIVRRNGHPHLALPPAGEAARIALALYQPQRPAGRIVAAGLHAFTFLNLHRRLARPLSISAPPLPEFDLPLPAISPGTCGIMLGSPEHIVRRAIASYRTPGGWEVAKIALGREGKEMLTLEAATLREFSARTSAAPPCLGLHRAPEVTILRMPRITGTPIARGSIQPAISLLCDWISTKPPQPVAAFPEWNAILRGISDDPRGERFIKEVSKVQLTPVLRHGDFARWNLLEQPGGRLIALDWEWGGTDGMPGLDLVHYVLQDARLVDRLPPADAIAGAIERLREPQAAAYLQQTGWPDRPLLPIIASLAYKQGADQQDNAELLREALGGGMGS